MPDFSPGMMENIEVAIVFLIIDLVITVVILPFALRRSDDKRWIPMRLEIINRLNECHQKTTDLLERDFRTIFSIYLCQHVSSRETWELKDTRDIHVELVAARSDLRDGIDLLAPAIEPNMASPIIELMKLPVNASNHLRKIDEYLTDILFYDESLGRSIYISNAFRNDVSGDIAGLAYELSEAGRQLFDLVSSSFIPPSDRARLQEEISNRIGRQAEIMQAADGLMELLIHRIFYVVENMKYDAVEDWLKAHWLTDGHRQAIMEFGDDDVVKCYNNLRQASQPASEAA